MKENIRFTRFKEVKHNDFGVAGVVLVICRSNPKTRNTEVLVESCNQYKDKTKQGDISLPMETLMWDGQQREDYKTTITRCLEAELKIEAQDVKLSYIPGRFYHEYQFNRLKGESGQGLAFITVLWQSDNYEFPTGIVNTMEVTSTNFVCVSELIKHKDQKTFRQYPPFTVNILEDLNNIGLLIPPQDNTVLAPFRLRSPKYDVRALRDFKR